MNRRRKKREEEEARRNLVTKLLSIWIRCLVIKIQILIACSIIKPRKPDAKENSLLKDQLEKRFLAAMAWKVGFDLEKIDYRGNCNMV